MNPNLYQQIYDIIRLIPSGKVANYGQIADIVGNCNVRMVGYAVSSILMESDIPWQRVINYKGEISLRSSGSAQLLQQKLLETEGVIFDQSGRTDLEYFRWEGE